MASADICTAVAPSFAMYGMRTDIFAAANMHNFKETLFVVFGWKEYCFWCDSMVFYLASLCDCRYSHRIELDWRLSQLLDDYKDVIEQVRCSVAH